MSATVDRTVRLRIEGRRLRAIRLSPASTAAGLALVVLALVGWIASVLLDLPLLGGLASASAFCAMALLAVHMWRRLRAKGRVLFFLPAALISIAITLAQLGLPFATLFAWCGGIAFLVAIAFGLVPRGGVAMASAQLNLVRASAEPSLLRSELPAEHLALELDERELRFGDDDVWRVEEIASAHLEPGFPLVLRVADRIGDEIAIEVDPDSNAAAKALVKRFGA
jgi:MFS family permease